MRKVFITGATGFIGSNLVDLLLNQGIEVYALIRSPLGIVNKKAIIVNGDLLNPSTYQEYIEKCDTVFHCAAYISFSKKDYEKAYRINVEGTRKILIAALNAKIKKVVYLSACGVLGHSDKQKKYLDETSFPEISKNNVYAYTKKRQKKKF